MGTWDASSFGNDTANDWAYGLEECNDLSHIETTLQQVLDVGEEYLDADMAAEAVAAAEVVAWLDGKPAKVDAYTEKIADWVTAHAMTPTAEVKQKAVRALARIQQEPSELLELWEGDPDWVAAMNDLRNRLSE